MIKLLVLADDYTGALDTGVQFAAKKCRVKVIHRSETGNREDEIANIQASLYLYIVESDLDVLVYDTETRHVDEKTAYRIVYEIARYAFEKGVHQVYKKTDSALRGNVGAELEAVANAYISEVVFIPSYPEMNRVLRGGIYYVDETILSESIFARDILNPMHVSEIQRILESQTDISVKLMEEEEDIEDEESIKLFVYNAETQEEIRRITQKLHEKGKLKVMAGCAGFAQELSYFLFEDSIIEAPEMITKPAVVICGSLNGKSMEQIEYAKKKGCKVFTLGISAILDGTFFQSTQWEKLKGEILFTIRSGVSVVLHTENIRIKTNQSGMITRQLGEISLRLISEESVRNLYIIGGDTLFGFMAVSEIREVIPLQMRNIGVVVSEIVVMGQSKRLISKAGGSGNIDAICEIL